MSDEQKTTSLQNLKNPPSAATLPMVTMGFGNSHSFELIQRAAKMLAYSTLVPVAYRASKEIKEYGRVTGYEENPNALPNCVVALNMAQRMGADPLMVMQNLYIVEGRPSWSSQFIIAAINSCGRYTPLRFQLSEPSDARPVKYMESKWVKVPGQKDKREEVEKSINVRNQTCVAWAIEKETGERLESPMITIDMAVAEGWLTKNGSKWQTMPEVMLRYRAAAFFGKLYAPELLMGLQTAEEAHDIIEMELPDAPTPTSLTKLRTPAPSTAAVPADDISDAEVIDQDTGEVTKPDTEPKSEAGTAHAGPTSETSSSADPAAGTAAAAPTFAQVADAMSKATALDVLDVAAEMIAKVANVEQQDELRGIYKDHKKRLAAPAAAKRRAAAADPGMNME